MRNPMITFIKRNGSIDTKNMIGDLICNISTIQVNGSNDFRVESIFDFRRNIDLTVYALYINGLFATAFECYELSGFDNYEHIYEIDEIDYSDIVKEVMSTYIEKLDR